MTFEEAAKHIAGFALLAFAGALIACIILPSAWLTLNLFGLKNFIASLNHGTLFTSVLSLALHSFASYLLLFLIVHPLIEKIFKNQSVNMQNFILFSVTSILLLSISFQAGILAGLVVPIVSFIVGWAILATTEKLFKINLVHDNNPLEKLLPNEKPHDIQTQLELALSPTQIRLGHSPFSMKPDQLISKSILEVHSSLPAHLKNRF